MPIQNGIALLLAGWAVLGVISTVPFALAAIDYRQRDNGLAFLLLIIGVGIWNLVFVSQLLSSDPMIGVFFLSLSIVGAVLAALGWVLFATTASSTSDVLHRRSFYTTVSIVGGIDIVFAVTAPIHTFYWNHLSASVDNSGFVTIQPEIGYWLHTIFLAVLFGIGAALFALTWLRGPTTLYARAYTISGSIVVVSIVVSNMVIPGGFDPTPIAAILLTTIGWVQATRGQPVRWLK